MANKTVRSCPKGTRLRIGGGVVVTLAHDGAKSIRLEVRHPAAVPVSFLPNQAPGLAAPGGPTHATFTLSRGDRLYIGARTRLAFVGYDRAGPLLAVTAPAAIPVKGGEQVTRIRTA